MFRSLIRSKWKQLCSYLCIKGKKKMWCHLLHMSLQNASLPLWPIIFSPSPTLIGIFLYSHHISNDVALLSLKVPLTDSSVRRTPQEVIFPGWSGALLGDGETEPGSRPLLCFNHSSLCFIKFRYWAFTKLSFQMGSASTSSIWKP